MRDCHSRYHLPALDPPTHSCPVHLGSNACLEVDGSDRDRDGPACICAVTDLAPKLSPHCCLGTRTLLLLLVGSDDKLRL